MLTVERLWAAGEMPVRDGLYRVGGTALKLNVPGPGAYHPEAGQPIPFHIGAPFDAAHAVEEDGSQWVDVNFVSPLPDGSGWISGGGGGMGNIGYIACLDPDRSLRWVAGMFRSNPFVAVRFNGPTAVLTNDWRNHLVLDLSAPAFR